MSAPKLPVPILFAGVRTGPRALRRAVLVLLVVLVSFPFYLPVSPVSAQSQDAGKDFALAAENGYPTGIWSDGTTMWVADFEDAKLYAYNMPTESRDAGKDFTLRTGNSLPVGIWSDGTTMWVADFRDAKLYAYSMSTKARDPGKDFDTLRAAGNLHPEDIWSDGTTMWVGDIASNKLYAYSLLAKTRDAGKDFDTLRAASNGNPIGMWSDGATMWVADWRDIKAYAYSMSTKARDPDKDFTLAAGNDNPEGMWSDGTTMWVADREDDKLDGDKLYAYAMPPGVIVNPTSLTVAEGGSGTYTMTLNAAPTADVTVDITAGGDVSVDPTSVTFSSSNWSAAQTVTVSAADDDDAANDTVTLHHSASTTDTGYSGISVADVRVTTTDDDSAGVTVSVPTLTVAEGGSGTYTMALDVVPTADVTIDITAGGDVSVSPTSLTFNSSNWNAAQTVTVSAADDDDAANDTVTLQHSARTTDTGYSGISVASVQVTTTDDDSAGVTVSVPTLTVAEGGSSAYTMALDVVPTADVTIDITAGGDVSVSPTSLTFNSSNWNAAQTVTVSAAEDDDATNDIQTVSHSIGRASASEYTALTNLADVEVTVTDATVCEASASPFAHNCHQHFTLATGNKNPTGIWSDGTTVWVADDADRKLYAYNLPTKARVSGKDLTALDASNVLPAGIWSDGTTMWAAERGLAKLYAYRMSDGERDADKDFDTLRAAGNTAPRGIWSDGTTMWVADAYDDKTYAYDMSTKARDAGQDFDTLSAAGNDNPQGIWSDGTTMWVADASGDKTYAYDMSTKARDAGQDFDTLSAAGNTAPQGLWSDGTTMWVVDASDDETYAYNMPGGGSTVSNIDEDSAGVSVSPTSLTVDEGGSGSYTIELEAQPTADVTVNIASGGDVTTSPSSLTFTTSDWNAAQTVTVSAAEDDDSSDDTQTVSHSIDSAGAVEYAALTDLASVEVTVAEPFWSARLTVGSDGSNLGFDVFTGLGSLSSRSFSVDGRAPHTVVGSLYVDEGDNLYFIISSPRPTAFTLDVGGFPFSSRDAEATEGYLAHWYRWTAGELSLSVGDHVRVSLVLTDSADIEPATGFSYTLTSSEEGETVPVKDSLTDDGGNDESLTSAATDAVAARPSPLTASLESLPDSHRRTGAFTFDIRFSENVKLSFRRMRDHAFEVTGGNITRAKRLEKGSNIGWRITVMPSSDGDVDIVLPVTTDCGDQAAVCTHDGVMLSEEVSFTVPGPEPK